VTHGKHISGCLE